MRGLVFAALLAPGLAFAQSAPLTGPNAAAVHGQAPAGRQAITAPAAPSAGQAAPQRAQRQATTAQPRTRNTSPLGTVNPRTATGPAGGRVSASETRHEAQLNEARRRQRAAEARATAARDGGRPAR